MVVHEFRVPVQLTVEEFSRGQLYMVSLQEGTCARGTRPGDARGGGRRPVFKDESAGDRRGGYARAWGQHHTGLGEGAA